MKRQNDGKRPETGESAKPQLIQLSPDTLSSIAEKLTNDRKQFTETCSLFHWHIVNNPRIIIEVSSQSVLDQRIAVFGVKSIRGIIYSWHFTDPMDELLLDLKNFNLTKLVFPEEFDQPVDGLLPPSLKCITFGDRFNQSVDELPGSLTHLKFGKCFNKSVDQLPGSLTDLIFGWNFNQSVDQLPGSLTHLKFGGEFNRPVDGLLPPSLKRLTFGYRFNQPVDKLPQGLEVLKFLGRYFSHSLGNLPRGIKDLEIPNCYKGLLWDCKLTIT